MKRKAEGMSLLDVRPVRPKLGRPAGNFPLDIPEVVDVDKPVTYAGTTWYSQEQVDKLLEEKWVEWTEINRQMLGEVHRRHQVYFDSMLN